MSEDCSGIYGAERLQDLSGDDHVTVVTVTDLYLFMGRELEALDCVPAGNVLGKHNYIIVFICFKIIYLLICK